jgi:hypothetical protein
MKRDLSDEFTSGNPPTEAAILARFIERAQTGLSPGAAEYLLSIRFDDRNIARMNELSELGTER